MGIIKACLFLFVLLTWSPNSMALLSFEDAVFPELATNGRALAMGNAFISRVDDSSSIFYNPAGLGSIRWSHFHLTNFHFETNKGLIDMGSSGNISAVPGNAMKGFNLDGTRQLLLQNKGTFSYNRVNAMPNISTRYFSLGYLYSQQTRATIGAATGASFEFAKREDHGPFVGLNFSLFGGVIKLGGSIVYLYRKEIIQDRDQNSSVDLQSSDYNKGTSVIGTGGAKLVLPITFLPTFSAVIHNAFGRPFIPAGGAGPPANIKKTVDVGFSLTPQIGNSVRVAFEGNYKDISKQFPDVNSMRKILLGMELDFGRVMFLRFGYGDGFGSAGLGLKSKRLEFDLTTYAVDTTSSGFRGKEDRRFAMTVSSGI